MKTLPRLKVRAKITVTDEPVYKTVVKKEPKIEVTKMSADQAGIQVDVNNGGAGVRGVSKIYVYKGSKRSRLLQVLPQVNTHLLIRQKEQVRQNIRRKSK